MYQAKIYPMTETQPNQTVVIANYQFQNLQEAVEFVNQYNAYSLCKVAVLDKHDDDDRLLTAG
jgi:hypothetical protein